MQILLAAVGALKSGPLLELLEMYRKRLQWTLTIKEVIPKAHEGPEGEGQRLLALIPPKSHVILLDERGKNLSSVAFAQLLEEACNQGCSSFAFLIGGADGVSQAVRERADTCLSFGAATWPHMLVRVLLVEQLYRAQQILAHHPYHRP